MKKSAKDLSFRDLAQMARQDAERFSEYIIGEPPTYRSSREVRFFENQSLVVCTAGPKAGKFRSFSDDSAHGDLFDLWRYIRGGSAHDAVMGFKRYANLLDLPPDAEVDLNASKSPEELQRQREEEDRKRIRAARWIWRNSSDTAGRQEAEAYLSGRGITTLPSSSVIRFRPLSAEDLRKMRITLPEAGCDNPTSIIFAATDQNGQITAVQQILVANGRKLPVDAPKRSHGRLAGSSVKLRPAGDVETLILAEGPETGLSIFQATGLPVDITLGSSNFTKIDMPQTVKRLVIAADLDSSGTGIAAALRAAHHWHAQGIDDVRIALPDLPGREGDFNDVLQAQGDDAVRAAIMAATAPARIRNDDVALLTANPHAALRFWEATGIATIVRMPGINKATGRRSDINVAASIEEKHRFVFLLEEPGFRFDATDLADRRPDVHVIPIPEDPALFMSRLRDPGYVMRLTQQVDVHAPGGLDGDGRLFVTLRRRDADALHADGHQAVAIRATEAAHTDLSFTRGRHVILAPIGEGTTFDRTLETRLRQTAGEVTTLRWPLFPPAQSGVAVTRTAVPRAYGAAEAISEGWRGDAMEQLITLSSMPEAPRERDAGTRESTAPLSSAKGSRDECVR